MWRGTEEPLDEVERGEWKSWLKIQHSKNEDYGIWSHISQQIDGGKVKTVTKFIFLGSKITADGDCSHEIKRYLLLRKKAMTNLDSILKSRDITLLTNVHVVQAMVFPVAIYGCESRTIKKAITKELMLSNYGPGEDSWESLWLQRDQTSQS